MSKKRSSFHYFFDVVVAGYGLYCMISQTAYFLGPETSRATEILVMTGHHAVVFGFSLIAFTAAVGLPDRILAKSTLPPGRIRFVGACVFVAGVTYMWLCGIPLRQA